MNHDVYSGYAIRQAAWQFLSGKAVSALLTFIILLWLVRMLPVAEYGAYVVFMACAELGIMLSGVGLPWLAARYLPDYRLHAAGPVLGRLCRHLMVWQALALIVLAAITTFAMDFYLCYVGLTDHKVAAWLALVLVIAEGLGRFVREGLMTPLMLQGSARMSLILRQSLFLVAIATLFQVGRAGLAWVVAAEVGASLASGLFAWISLSRHLSMLQAQMGEFGWLEPRLAEQWRIAFRMHSAQLISLTYSGYVFINIIQRAIGAEAVALFGFLRVLFEQTARYLPATLLFSVLRPKLIASHLQGGMAAISQQVNLAGKLSLLVLLPLVVLVALGGDDLVEVLSGGKFTDGGFYLLGLLLTLVPFSQRQLLETVAVASGQAGICTLASAIGLLALPLMLLLLNLGLGLWAPVVAILFGQIIFNAAMILGLARIGYRSDLRGAAKLAASAMLAWLLAAGVYSIERNLIWFALACLLAVMVFLFATWRLQAFRLDERQRLDGVLGWRLFAR